MSRVNIYHRAITLCVTGFALLFFSSTSCAKAISEFLICDNCTTSSQFANAAKFRPIRTGDYYYAVGNRTTGKMMYVFVVYTAPGEVPRAIPYTNSMEQPALFETKARSPLVSPFGHYLQENSETLAGGVRTATASSATPQENAMFGAMVGITDKRIIVSYPPSNPNGFSSLAGAQYEQIGPYLWGAMTVNNPGWNTGAFSENLLSDLYNALGWLNGHGPVACLIFENGDYGCFQLNVEDENAPRYLEGTGKDKNGNPIDRSDGMTNGAGISTTVTQGPGTDVIFALSESTGEVWCAVQNGVVLDCWVEYHDR